MSGPPLGDFPKGPRPDGDCARRLSRAPAQEPADVFAVMLTCIDGRVHQPLTEWIRSRYGVDYADVVTEPGIDAVLAAGSDHVRQALLDKICVSRLAHHSGWLVVAGHHDCAANPVDRATHELQTTAAVEFLRSALPRLDVVGVYVDENWTPQAIGA